MDDAEVGRYWKDNAQAWTVMTRAGYDLCRLYLNTPAFLEMLGDVAGLHGLDLGCGEGSNTRVLAERGARMTGIDIAQTFIRHAREAECEHPLGIGYFLGSAQQLPFENGAFDFVTAFMSLMDMPQPLGAVEEAYRVLKPGGILQFSITHPCFNSPAAEFLRDEYGRKWAVKVRGYFSSHHDIEEWIFGTAPAELKARFNKFKVPRFHMTMSQWLNGVRDAGFTIDRLCEPCPSDELVAEVPEFSDEQQWAYFLHVRCIKPVGLPGV